MNINDIKELHVECFGCEECAYVCHKSCITFTDEQNGFKYPIVDEASCIQCGKCYIQCPINIAKIEETFRQKSYAAISLERESRQSASGGLFYTIAKYVIEDLQGVVYGCAFTEALVAEHIRVDNIVDLKKLQGSKYVQSDMDGVYDQIESDLRYHRKVLFSGTPCQVTGVKQAFKEYKNDLITIDIICHGVPSPKLFASYICWIEKKNGKVRNYVFRNHFPNLIQGYKAKIEANKTMYRYAQEDPYYRAFIRGETYRPSCYRCKYASVHREGDISLGDCSSIIYDDPFFAKSRAASLLMINSEYGERIVKSIQSDIKMKSIDILQEMKYNTQLSYPSSTNQKRYDEIYELLDADQERLFTDILTTNTYAPKQRVKICIKRAMPEFIIRVIRYMIKKGAIVID